MRLFKKASVIGVFALALAIIAAPTFVGAVANAHAQERTSEQQTTDTEQETETKDLTTENEADTNETEAKDAKMHASDAREAAKNRVDVAKANAQTRLEGAKLKSCQNREKAITNIMSRIADRGQKQYDLFSSIANRVEAFYTEKGKTITTYDALTADLATKKAAAKAAIDAVNATDTTFKCDGTNPKGMVSSFKDSLKTEISALKEYRTSVKNLIVGVKSAQSTTVPADTTEGSKE